MATRIDLTENESNEALKILSARPEALSKWIGQKLEARLQKHPQWKNSRPIQLGSWSRDELCIRSDIDLLFVGDEAVVKTLVQDLNEEGIKLRYRVPADKKDWTKGVEAFDVLALLSARPFFSTENEVLNAQKNKIAERGTKYYRELFKQMLKERQARTKRYDSIANYLEPNLKYGPGGLRDLEQGLMAARLFSEKFVDHAKAIQKLEEHKKFFLKVRHYLHLHGAQDILLGALQKDMAQFFGDASIQELMASVEKSLSEVSFYADWVTEVARLSPKKLSQFKNLRLGTLEEALQALKHNSSIVIQEQVRAKDIITPERKKTGRLLEKYFNSDLSDDRMTSLFRSKLMSQLISNLERVTGLVQHDQYHRYSVDAHTLQAVREVLKVKRNPKILGRLAKFARLLTNAEWEVLLWTALYHDLGKGLKGDHSHEGADIVKSDLIQMGVSLKLTAQVSWMVNNHLLLSGAAFRQNPNAPSTWAELFRRGVKDRRILKLVLFTAIDIRATNPEAWNDWKERLLFELAEVLLSPKASRLSEFLEYAALKKIKVAREFIENLDPQVVESVPKGTLLQDYLALKNAKHNLSPLIVKSKSKDTWVRFHAKKDRPGLFLSFTHQLHAAGLGVQEAFVQTFNELGAYDWFKVKTSKSTATLKSLMKSADEKPPEIPAVDFSVIDLVSQDEKSAILSFRGRDQRGALLAAAGALFNEGLEIESAKVHTWGRQIDDIFTVKAAAHLKESLEKMRQKLTQTPIA